MLALAGAPSHSSVVRIFNELLPRFYAHSEFGGSMNNEYKPKINLRKSVIVILLAIVLMTIAGWLLAHEDFYQMFTIIRSANRLLIAAAIAIYFLSIAVWAARWQAALSFINHRIRFGVRYLVICAAIFLNNITPVARIGGDPFGRIYMVHKLENMNYSSAMASLIGERFPTPLIVVSFLMAGLLLQFGKESLQLSLIITTAWILAAFGTVFIPRLFLKKKIASKAVSSITSRVLGWLGKGGNAQEVIEGIETFYSYSYATIDKWKKILLVGSLALLIGALDVFRLYTIFVALGYYPKFSILLIASALPTLVGLIPFLPGGLVLIEGSLISVLALLGVPLNLALAATVIERGISFVLSTIVGAVVFSYLGVKIAAKPEIHY